MSRISEIFSGFRNLLFGNPAIEQMAQEREAICAICPHAGVSIYLHCNLCGCYIPAKSRSPLSKCPDGRWPSPTLKEKESGNKTRSS